MNKDVDIPRCYGVKEQLRSETTTDLIAEHLQISGFAIADGGYSETEQARISDAFDSAFEQQVNEHQGIEALREIDEHNTIRMPMIYERALADLAANPTILSICERVFNGSHTNGAFMLNQQNGVVNPENGQKYNQGAYHRDLPYQHFVSSRPLAINALYCIDPFTIENGATFVIPGSHRQEMFPSNRVVRQIEQQVTAPAGSFLVLDCMVFHSGGVNKTKTSRRAVNHVYSLPFIKQQISFETAFKDAPPLHPDLRRLLGIGTGTAATPAA